MSDQLVFPSVLWLAIAQILFGQFGVMSHGIRDKTGVCTLNYSSKIRVRDLRSTGVIVLFSIRSPYSARLLPCCSYSKIIRPILKISKKLQGVDVLYGSQACALHQLPDLFNEREEGSSIGFYY